ncbi:MAG: hypothetical protein RML35_08310 [Chloroherpetonaceae bacterium]|nr:hypothetical protein [Chloroherpetonaceae bacterium]
MPVVEKATLPQSSPSQANGLSAPDSITSGQQFTKPRLREDEQKLPLLIGLGIVYAIVFWWFSTAAIIYFNFQPAYRGIVFGIALALLIMALYVLHAH